MKKLVLALAALAWANLAQAATLVHNINGYTMDGGELVRFAALEFDDGKVTRLYASAGEATGSSASERIDGNGATLLPGLIDAHGHVGIYGELLGGIHLAGVASESSPIF